MDTLKGVRHLSYELARNCNLALNHRWCPSASSREYVKGPRLYDAEIIESINDAVENLGFDGYVGFHYYNEPLLSQNRIIEIVGKSNYGKFMLWTNGVLFDRCNLEKNDLIVSQFQWIMITDYTNEAPFYEHLKQRYPNVNITVQPCLPDSRISNYSAPEHRQVRCNRPSIEVPIDCIGNVHLCCQDWKGEYVIGNIKDKPLSELLTTPEHLAYIEALKVGSEEVPNICKTCTNPI